MLLVSSFYIWLGLLSAKTILSKPLSTLTDLDTGDATNSTEKLSANSTQDLGTAPSEFPQPATWMEFSDRFDLAEKPVDNLLARTALHAFLTKLNTAIEEEVPGLPNYDVEDGVSLEVIHFRDDVIKEHVKMVLTHMFEIYDNNIEETRSLQTMVYWKTIREKRPFVRVGLYGAGEQKAQVMPWEPAWSKPTTTAAAIPTAPPSS